MNFLCSRFDLIMWKRLASSVLKFRFPLLMLLLTATAIMGYFASQVKLSYEFSKAIPPDNPKYLEYVEFKKLFGEDGNTLVAGVQHNDFFNIRQFEYYQQLVHQIKSVPCVEDVLSVSSAIILRKDSVAEKLQAQKIFGEHYVNQASLDSAVADFRMLPFYRSMLYNPSTRVYLMAVRINKDSLNSPKRVQIINGIAKAAEQYEQQTGKQVHLSGLPLIRTQVAERIQKEMKWFLLGSLALSILILLLFFRSWSTTLVSMSVVLMGVIWTIGLIHLCGYKITLLTALIPSLVVVIGIPNCIYFINKYHTSFLHSTENDAALKKTKALTDMVSKMGVVTLFCNITAAIGFAVFALTKSAILVEFGVVAGISIMLIFVISFIFLPSVLSYLSAPGSRELNYLHNGWIESFLERIEVWVMNHRTKVMVVAAVVTLISIAGIFRLKTVAFILDDLPKTDKVYTDLKFFEQHFKGIMPLEILVDTKKKSGLTGMKSLSVFEKVDSLSAYISAQPEMNRPLSVAEGLKFAKQGFYENDSTQYLLPNAFDGAFVGDYLRAPKRDQSKGNLAKMLSSFIDSSRRYTRISVSMADVGTERLPGIMDSLQLKANHYFGNSCDVKLTGTSITFLEGSKYIINGLKESIFWAFLLIAICMLYLFRSVRVLLCSIIPNLIPLVITAGIMGWAGVPLKPSTVLVFSVALGIAIDITIRFLVNYKQILPEHPHTEIAVQATVQQTGLSIIYTSLVLMAGFVIFCLSGFGGTFALGWLTSVTLLTATLTNLILLPVLLILFNKTKRQ